MGKKVRNYKYKNIAAAMAIVLLSVLAVSTSCSSDAKSNDKKTSKDKPSVSSSADVSSSQTDVKKAFSAGKLTKNYKYINVNNSLNLGMGKLTIVNASYPYSGAVPDDLEGVYGYLFDKSGTQIGVTRSTEVVGRAEMLIAYNQMLQAFYNDTKLATIMVKDMYIGEMPVEEDSSSDEEDTSSEEQEDVSAADKPCFEHDTGYAVDLQLYLADEGTYPEFDGTGRYTWFAENCWKYGFIQRYTDDKSSVTGVEAIPEHFRYVGMPHAQIMHENSLSLEEYTEFLKNHDFESPYSFEDADGNGYALYYVPKSAEKATNCPIPLKENDEEYDYEISGDNVNGYIVCALIKSSKTESPAEDSAADTSSVAESAAG